MGGHFFYLCLTTRVFIVYEKYLRLPLSGDFFGVLVRLREYSLFIKNI